MLLFTLNLEEAAETYPLAGIAQDYPLDTDATYPLAGIRQSYPLGEAA